MAYDLSISSPEEEFETIRRSIIAFLETYGTSKAKLYEPDTLIEEDGLTVSGEYGSLDALFTPIRDPRLSRSENFDDGRLWLKWVVVIYTV